MIDPSNRLRRAIHLADLPLLKRIVKTHPTLLQNPDFTDNGNTCLHLAASLGLYDIVLFLIDAGHEDGGISRNGSMDTPLHLAVECKEGKERIGDGKVVGGEGERVAELLARRFTRCVGWRNGAGLDAVMLTTHHAHPTLLSTLLALTLFAQPPNPTSHPTSLMPGPTTTSQNPAAYIAIPGQGSTPPYNPLTATDSVGNTALHHASAYGQLKAIRTLMEHGADPNARNAWSWTPVSYSASVQAEVYFRGLVGAQQRAEAGDGGGGGGVGSGSGGRSRGGSGGTTASGGGKGGGGVRMVAAAGRDEEGDEGGRFAVRGAGSAEMARLRSDSGGGGLRGRAGSWE